MDEIVTAALKKSFQKTDADFIATSEHAQNGYLRVHIIRQTLNCVFERA
jgi:hypothetical protein